MEYLEKTLLFVAGVLAAYIFAVKRNRVKIGDDTYLKNIDDIIKTLAEAKNCAEETIENPNFETLSKLKNSIQSADVAIKRCVLLDDKPLKHASTTLEGIKKIKENKITLLSFGGKNNINSNDLDAFMHKLINENYTLMEKATMSLDALSTMLRSKVREIYRFEN